MAYRFVIDDAGVAHTKRALRLAFADHLPSRIVERPKASFPLPFQRWCAAEAGRLVESRFLREVFKPSALAAVAADPGQHWNLAWPLLNLAMWGDGV